MRYQLVPECFGQCLLHHLPAHLVLDESIHKAGIEVVTGTDGAHRAGLYHGIFLTQCILGTQLHRLGSVGADELLGIESHIAAVDGIGIFLLEQHLKVVHTATHHMCQLKIFEQGVILMTSCW